MKLQEDSLPTACQTFGIISSAALLTASPGSGTFDLITDKINKLFISRGVFSLAKVLLDSETFREWKRHAVSVQRAIYDLDLHYESSTLVGTPLEAGLWREVERRILSALQFGEPIALEILEDLKKYAVAEQRIHAFDAIELRELSTILSFKCADVRIARSLIFNYSSRPEPLEEAIFWSNFDQCWEIIEDLADVTEDGNDWNLNVWLYWFMSGGSGLTGLEYVSDLLRQQVRRLEEAYSRISMTSRTLCGPCFVKTIRSATHTMEARGQVLAFIQSGDVTPFSFRMPAQ